MDIPLSLSGNFMEPRNDHFHSGLDMRTEGREGIPVRAVADGWVSRIKISPWGYGKAVYIDHPDGHTSVYGHLQQLKGAVAEACLEAQYRNKDYSIDITPERGAIPLKQGEVIALSGNTGGSEAPHLHFELRRTSDQHALDPQALGIEVADKTPPEIIGVRLFALTDSSRVSPYPGKAKGFAVQGSAGRYTLKPGNSPAAYGTIGLAVHTVDYYDGNGAKCGPRSIELFVDSVAAFSTHFDDLDFSVNRYCNAHMDYAMVKEQKMEYHRCFRQPNNKLRIYGSEPMQGRVVMQPGHDHHIRLRVTDSNGNRTELVFLLHGAARPEALAWPHEETVGSLFRYDTENVLVEDGMRLTLPANALYDDTYVRYERKPAPTGALAPLHVVHSPLTPIQSPCDLSIDVANLPPDQRNKALIVKVNELGKVSGIGGRFAEGHVTAQVRAFGAYTVMIDTVPPVITNFDLRADMRGRSAFSMRVGDNLSGVETWRGTINGEWVLLQ
ncbi:MAG: M23 family metallopeptidase, partial [Flavobacteriales bacterium]